MTYRGRWHGKKFYFGLHYDLHAGETDTALGTHCDPSKLAGLLELMRPDFVQTDCKGHPGMTSWFSRVPTATVSPGTKKDALAGWRTATKRLGMPLHCHYSGIWDAAAAKKFPDWAVVPNPATKGQDNSWSPKSQKMCPRGPYIDELLIPQMLELIDRYEVDGFWVDGEIWAVEPCYCERCRSAFEAKTGIAEPPTETSDPNWVAWIGFQRESFEAYVTRYCDAVHAHKPGVLVCSNWLQTFCDPGEPKVPTDWISGDNSWVFGYDSSRCEARFISTRGKPWDIMLWAFYKSRGMGDQSSPWTFKPVQMLEQEAAVTLALGGNIQIYEHPPGLRDGRLAPWRMKRLGQVGRFVKARKSVCQGTETIPQIAVLHSEHHHRSQPVTNLHWGYDTSPVRGAVYSLLECSYGVDILDEWALLPKLQMFPIVVAPEQDRMSDAAVEALKAYTSAGGRLVLTGAAAYDRFGGDFLGVESVELKKDIVYYVPAAGGNVPVFSRAWRLVRPTSATAFGRLATTALLDEELLPNPAVTVNKVRKGAVAYAPFDLFRFFHTDRYPMVRAFIGDVVEELAAKLEVRVRAPIAVDVILRRKAAKRIIHLINRSSGIPNQPHNGAIDDIFAVGPITIELPCEARPKKVATLFEKSKCTWTYTNARHGGKLRVVVPSVTIHEAVVVG